MRLLCVLLQLLFCLSSQLLQAEEPANYSHEEKIRLGERMYRDGTLPSGEPMQALVMGDIPVDGRMFACDNCHQRSGLGSEEGTVITYPTNGKELYIPRRRAGAFKPVSKNETTHFRRPLPEYFQVKDARPAYTDKSLARVLLTGTDSAGHILNAIMPKYRLNSSDMKLLIYYLKHLSDEFSPGVDDETLHFATVITANVPEDQKYAMLSVLNTHIDTHNSLSRHEDKRAASGPFYKTEMHHAFRKLQLDIWELTGPESGWRDQLEEYYSRQPVFALLGGITEGSWEKIHAFSEEHRVPCIFPITDLPVVSDSDWYTLYFSKGYYQEGESAARHVRAQSEAGQQRRIVQVYRPGNKRSAMLARGFSETWKKMGGMEIGEVVLDGHDPAAELTWDSLSHLKDPLTLLVWLGDEDLNIWQDLRQHIGQTATVFASATLLDFNFKIIPDTLRDSLLITYPVSLPGQEPRSRFVVEKWLEARKISPADFDIQAKMYFLGWMLPGSIKHLRSEFYRDYFLEGYDMMVDQDYAIAIYPRLTFGPGQRYASKGCYIVRLTAGDNPEPVPASDWILY